MPQRPEPSESLHVEYRPNPPLSPEARTFDGIQYYGEAAVDIIAVQGLGSWYDWTWSVQASKHGPRYFWLRDSIRKSLPHARVLAYDYNTDWFGDPNRVTLQECGARLLRTVILDRTHVGRAKMCPCRSRRPIIFMGHSFGGLVIKQSLILASQTVPSDPNYDDHRAYLSAVTSVMFMGTPHAGSSFLSLAKWKIRAGKMIGVNSNDEILKILDLNSNLLNKLQDDFETAQERPELARLQMYCYYETKDVKEGIFNAGLVVTKSSACLPGAECRDIEKDHMGLNKFGPHDKEYEEILKPDLLRCFRKADEVARTRFAGQEYGSDSANPDLMNLHHQLVPVASKLSDKLEVSLKQLRPMRSSGTTCSWIQDLAVFNDWKASKQFNVLWVHGKSGSGKSTLAAYITRHLQPKDSEISPFDVPCTIPIEQSSCTVKELGTPALYFLCGVEPASETPTGILGILLHQLLSRYSSNWQLHAIAMLAKKKLQSGGDIPAVAALLVELITIIGGAFIILDGLEENPQYEECIKTMALLSSPKIRLLLLSQNIFTVEQNLRQSFKDMVLNDIDIIEYTKADIDTVAEVKTAELVQTNELLAGKQDDIVRILQEQADGSFQWVVASLMHLNQGTVDPEDVESCLGSMHNGTSERYDQILEFVAKRAQPSDHQKIRAALMWACVAAVPLRTSHLLSLIELGQDSSDITLEEVEGEALSDKHAAARLKALLGSTVEVVESSHDQYFINLSHASFKDYITDPSRQASTEEAKTRNALKFEKENAQKYCAIITMSICSVSCLRLSQKNRLSAQHTLEDYAWRFWSYHFKLSHSQLTDESLLMPFNRMIKWVSGDVLAVLEGLGAFVSSRFLIDGVPRKRRLNFARSFQEAQKSLILPIDRLTELRTCLPAGPELQDHRRAVQDQEDQMRDGVALAANSNGILALSYPTHSGFSMKAATSKVGRVYIETLLANDSKTVRPSRLVILFAEIARGLRMSAARFAIDPVYAEMTARSSIGELSIITMLTSAANLFDLVSSYPYWKKAPAFIDPDLAFVTQDNDPLAEHSAIVIRRLLSTERTFAKELVVSEQANPEVKDAMQQPKTQLTPSSWYKAHLTYSTLGSRERSLTKTFFVNPLVNYQMRNAMYLDFDNARLMSDPRQNLIRDIPEEVKNNPVSTFIEAIPELVPVLFVRCIMLLSQRVDPWLWPMLQWQWMRMNMVRTHFMLFWQILCSIRDPQGVTHIGHWIFGILFYFLRRQYFPWFGAHMSPHPFVDTINVFQDPNKYFESSRYSWKQMIIYSVSLSIGNGILFPALAQVREAKRKSLQSFFVPEVYIVFWVTCTLERGFCQGVNAGLYPFAVASLLLHTPGFLKWALCVTIVYWIFSFLGVLHTILQLGLLQYCGGWGIFLGFVSYILCVWWMVTYGELITDHIWSALAPVRDALGVLADGISYAYIPVLEIIGILIMGTLILYGVSLFSKSWQDPLDLAGPASELRAVSAAAKGVLQDYTSFRIEDQAQALRKNKPFSIVRKPTIPAVSEIVEDVSRNVSRAARKYSPRQKKE